MSGTPSVPPIPSRSSTRERNCRKINISFRGGILQEYGSVKFSEIKDHDPILYAHSRRPKAILQAKALRRLDKALGLVPRAHEDTSTLSLKERRKRANRVTYENGVIGNRAVQECIRDLYIGYDIRHVSQQFKLARLQNENYQLENRLVEVEKKKSCLESFPNREHGGMHIHSFPMDDSGQAFYQDQLMMQDDVDRRIRAASGHPNVNGNFAYQQTFPSQRSLSLTSRADPVYENNDQSMQSNPIPHPYQRLIVPANQLTEDQRVPSLDTQPTEGLQSRHEQLRQYQLTQQHASFMNNQESVTHPLQPHHQYLIPNVSPPRGISLFNEAPQHFYCHAQPTFVPEKNFDMQDYTRANWHNGLGRPTHSQMISHGSYQPPNYSFDQQMSTAQNVNGNGMMPGNLVMESERPQTIASHWNTTVPIAYSGAISPNYRVER